MGKPQPLFKFETKRQCKLDNYYNKMYKWMCGCPNKKALFCYVFLVQRNGADRV